MAKERLIELDGTVLALGVSFLDHLGGASFEFFIHHAMLAIASGRCDVALIGYASRLHSRRNRKEAIAATDGKGIAVSDRPGCQSPAASP